MVFDSFIPVIDPPALEEDATFESVSTYRLLRRLGRGGMGEVWLAERISAGNHSQKVAIKFLFDAHAGRTLAREALRMSHLSHDNIVPFVDSGRDAGGRYFVAMAYMKGMDLDGLRAIIGLTPDSVYDKSAPHRIPEPIAGFVMFMVLRALSYAHEFVFDDGSKGIIHRDVSPGNVLIDEGKGSVKLTDFGVAAQISEAQPKVEIAGKVPYMSPETLTDGTVDARADLYSLGVVFYEMLTGFNPNLNTSHIANVISAITSVMLAFERPLRPPHQVIVGVNPEISKIVERLLTTDPNERYRSAEEVIADLTYCLYSSGVGPNTTSLSSFIKLVRDPEATPDIRDLNALPFLNSNGRPEVRAPWVLTAEAQEEIDNGRTPGRVW